MDVLNSAAKISTFDTHPIDHNLVSALVDSDVSIEIVKFVRNPTLFGLESYENVGKSRRSCRICCRFEKYLIDFELIGHKWVLLYTLVYPSHSML